MRKLRLKPNAKCEAVPLLGPVPQEVLDRGPAAAALYRQIIAAGETERWATMCALQSPPGARNTDRAFCQGQQRKMERMPAQNRQKIQALAQQAGIRTDGKFYMSGLGKYDNPAAWVSCAEDVVTSCKVQNKSVEGAVQFTPRTLHPGRPKPEPALAAELVAEFEAEYLQKDPGLAEKVRKHPRARRELREQIVEKHGRPRRVSTGKARLKL